MRIAQSQSWNSALFNLTSAQYRQTEANTQYSTLKKATNLKELDRDSSRVHAHQSALSAVKSYIEINTHVKDRLSAQDLALSQIMDSADDTRQTILNAIASDDATTLEAGLEGMLDKALTGLNYRHNGDYLFSGGQEETKPVGVSELSELLSLGTIDEAFDNGKVKKVSRLDDESRLETGFLAEDLGRELFSAFKDIKQALGTSGPFSKPLSAAQRTILTNFAQVFEKAHGGLIEKVSLNGQRQAEVEAMSERLQSESDSLTQLISDKTDVDMGEAYTHMQQAQIAVQASSQVISTLKNYSLLDYLR